jgi:D-alanine transaminase
MALENPIVYLNGEFLPLDQAKVSVLDRGFLFGDGIYEVIPVYGGRLFRLDEHLQRLEGSLAGIRMQSPLSRSDWEKILSRLIGGEHDQSVYLQITRGAALKRDHAIPDDVTPTVFAMCMPIAPIPVAGVSAVTLDDIRWQYCHIKAITLLPNVLLRQQAIDRGGVEAILARNGYVTEGAASNVFAVIDEVVVTPPKSHDLLPGITRDLILELACEHRIAAEERALALAELQRASEIWLTSSTREVLPVIRLDGKAVGDGIPGRVWREMYAIYQAYKDALRTGR